MTSGTLKQWVVATVAAVLLVVAPPTARGEDAEGTEERHCAICRSRESVSELIKGLEVGGDLRIRTIYDEARLLSNSAAGHERVWQRYRGRVWARVSPTDDLEFTVRLTTEPRYFYKPDQADQLIRNEALFDIGNVTIKNLFGKPLKATVGRQNLLLGSGWLVSEGTPLDGTRTLFFDAIRLTADLQDAHTTADLVFVDNHANSSEWIRPFNDQAVVLCEQDEQGVVLYVRNTSRPKANVDAYAIYKRDHNPQFAAPRGTQGEVYTLGGRVSGDLDDHWTYDVEVAPQFGRRNGERFEAFGLNSTLGYRFKDPRDNRLDVGYEYASGDDSPNGHFDKVWGRETKWSNLYSGNVDALDARPYDSTNLHRLRFGWSAAPTEKLDLQADYHLLFADDHLATAGGGNGLSRHGRFRGQLLAAQVSHELSEHVRNRIRIEVFFPGDYYDQTRNDTAVFVRHELVLTW